MELVSGLVSRRGGFRAVRKASAVPMVLLGVCTMGSVQAAQLACGPGSTPLRIHTAKATWSTDARYVSDPSGSPAAIVDDYQWHGWLNKATAVHTAGAGALAGQALQGDWLSFGDSTFTVGQANGGNTTSGTYPNGSKPYPAVITNGNTSNGALVSGRASFVYNEPITIGPNVNLSTIKIQGSGGFDDNTWFLVKPATTPSGATDWIRTQNAGTGWTALQTLSIDGSTNGLGFYYGDNTIGFAVQNFGLAPTDSQGNPTGVIADFTITADCLDTPPPQPTAPLMCPAGNKAGDPVQIGPFTTNARDWKWTQRTVDVGTGGNHVAGNTLEPVPANQQTLFDSYRYRSYFNPAALATPTNARWISPGTTDPGGADVPGVPYPFATGQHKAGYNASVFMLNQAITVGNNVDLNSIKLTGRFGFDNTGDSVWVQPAGQPGTYGAYALPDGYGAFTTATTPAIPGFARGQNNIGLMLDGGEFTNGCAGGLCAMAAIADFYVTATCTGVDPVVTPPAASGTRPVPVLGLGGLGLLGLLSAGGGALALRRRQRAQ